MIKRLFISIPVFAICSIAIAQESNIITENFSVVKISPEQKSTLSTNNDVNGQSLSENDGEDSNVIGNLGKFKVVQGEKAEDDLAFVISEDGYNHIIKDSITIKCKKGVQCVPSELNPKHVFGDIYEIKVASYNDWKQAIDTLKSLDTVKKVSATINYGIEPKLQ